MKSNKTIKSEENNQKINNYQLNRIATIKAEDVEIDLTIGMVTHR